MSSDTCEPSQGPSFGDLQTEIWLHHGIEWLAPLRWKRQMWKFVTNLCLFLSVDRAFARIGLDNNPLLVKALEIISEDYYKVFSHQLLLIKNLIIDCEMQSHVRVIRPGRADLEDGMQIYLSNFTLSEFSPQPITIHVFSLCVIKSQQRPFDTADHQQRW